jgi:hypothetical protein
MLFWFHRDNKDHKNSAMVACNKYTPRVIGIAHTKIKVNLTAEATAMVAEVRNEKGEKAATRP